MRTARFALLGLLMVGCAGPAATPIIVYVTPEPRTQRPVTAPPPTALLAATPTPAQSHTVTVKVSVSGTPFGAAGTLTGTGPSSCVARGGYSDIAPGMQATIRDAAGTVIGFATFENDGVSTETTEGPIGPVPTECTFTTIVLDVPDAPIYGIEVGRRGTVQFARAGLASNGWTAELTLGD